MLLCFLSLYVLIELTHMQTLLESLILASWGMWVDYHIIVTAFGITAGITFCLTIFALLSKSDFSGLEPYLYQVLFIAIIFGAMSFIVPQWVNLFTIISVAIFRTHEE